MEYLRYRNIFSGIFCNSFFTDLPTSERVTECFSLGCASSCSIQRAEQQPKATTAAEPELVWDNEEQELISDIHFLQGCLGEEEILSCSINSR